MEWQFLACLLFYRKRHTVVDDDDIEVVAVVVAVAVADVVVVDIRCR